MQTTESTGGKKTKHNKLNRQATCNVMVRVPRVESGGKRSFTPGSAEETSRVSAAVREQLSLTGQDTTMNQEKWSTAQQASCRGHKTLRS